MLGGASLTEDGAETCPKSFLCPITHEVMTDPVQTCDGYCYERFAITQWLQEKNTSPLTGLPLESLALTPSITLRSSIEEYFSIAANASKYNISFAELGLEDEVGSGAFKTVFRGKWKARRVAILVMNKGAESTTEAEVFARLGRRPGLQGFFGISKDPKGRDCIVTDFAPYGSLLRCVNALADLGCHLSAHVVISIARQVAQGMENLAHEGLIHRDLAARNVLCYNISTTEARDVRVRVGDYGLTRDGTAYYGGDDKLPLRWMSPETIERRRWSEKSDVWAFATTLWETMQGGKLPYYELQDSTAISKAILDGQRLSRPAECPDELWALLSECWAALPKDRPTFKAIGERLAAIEAKLFPSEAVGAQDGDAAGAGASAGGSSRVGEARVIALKTALGLVASAFPAAARERLERDLRTVVPCLRTERHSQAIGEIQGKSEKVKTEPSDGAEGGESGEGNARVVECPTFEEFADQCVLALSVFAHQLTVSTEEHTECKRALEQMTLKQAETNKRLAVAERSAADAAARLQQAEARLREAQAAQAAAEQQRAQAVPAIATSFQNSSWHGSRGRIQGVCETTGAPCRRCSAGIDCEWAYQGRPGHYN